MKQKVLINVSLNDKSRTKAMRIVVSDPGMDAFSWKGADKNQLEVVGDLDIIKLVTSIRNKFGFAEVVSVAPVKEEPKPKDKKPEKEKEKVIDPILQWPMLYYQPQWQNGNWIPSSGVLVDPHGHPYPAHNPNICSIM